MPDSLAVLTVAAASIGFIHTLLGPDHYLPFVMMARAGGWSRSKTLWITFWCGVGHVLSSVLIGAIGIAFGVALHRLEFIESVRGDIAAWLLAVFGVMYMLWGLRRLFRNKSHTHVHAHADGHVHEHDHIHTHVHAHAHESVSRSPVTAWALFTIFVLGPCEPLVPILMYPAAHHHIAGLIWITALFCIVTISTMLVTVALALHGMTRLPVHAMDRYSHALAGGMIACTGFAMIFLGL